MTSKSLTKYGQYQEQVTQDIKECFEDLGCQPILFIGSGFSKRYFSAPNWNELLKTMADSCPLITKEFAYYKQTYGDLSKVGEAFAEQFKEWAWTIGRKEFPEDFFDEAATKDIYLKFKVASFIKEVTPKSSKTITDINLREELDLFKAIAPHAIISTNYDQFLEILFEDYEPIIGQKVIHVNNLSIGEILKIHGCVTDPSSLVLTASDYQNFQNKQKYLSAKLLTYFAEHPLLIVGYSASDQNIKNILSDIDEILSPSDEVIPNIYLVKWVEEVDEAVAPKFEEVISLGENRSVRIKSITVSSLKWVLNAFCDHGPIEKVNPKLLRALMARTYQLVCHEVPKRTIEINYSQLQTVLNQEGEYAKILGISTSNHPSAVNLDFPYLLTNVANKIDGNSGWHYAQQLINKIADETGINIKESDNKYHVKLLTGKAIYHKYSEEAVYLLKQVHEGQPYKLK